MGPYLTLLVASRTTSAVAISVALSAHRVVGAAVLPVVGRFSDRTSTRAGRRVPLIVVGTIVAAFAAMAMPRTVGYWPLVGAIVIARVGMQIATVGRVGVTPDVFGRSRWAKAVGVIGAIGFLPGLLTLGLIRQTWDQDDPSTWALTFTVTGAALLVGALAIGALVREAPVTEEVAAIAAEGSWRDELRRIRDIPNGPHLIASVMLLSVALAGITRLTPVWARDELGLGGAEFADLSLLLGAVSFVLLPIGAALGSHANPRVLAVAAAVVGSACTGATAFVSSTPAFVLLNALTIPLTVAAFASLAPQFIPMFPKGDRLGQSWGMLVGPFGLMTSLAGVLSATVVDLVDSTDAIWVIASVLLLGLAVNLWFLDVAPGTRTDVFGLMTRARDAGLGPGLFDGTVDLEDVLGMGSISELAAEAEDVEVGPDGRRAGEVDGGRVPPVEIDDVT